MTFHTREQNAQCNAKKVRMNWFWKSFLYSTPALVWTILYMTHQLSKIHPWVYIDSFASIFSILWINLPHQKTLETTKSGPNELPKWAHALQNEFWSACALQSCTPCTPKLCYPELTKLPRWCVSPLENWQHSTEFKTSTRSHRNCALT